MSVSEEIWEGRVEEVNPHSFLATLKSVSLPEQRTVSAVISATQVPEEDRYALVPGALFMWHLARHGDDVIEHRVELHSIHGMHA